MAANVERLEQLAAALIQAEPAQLPGSVGRATLGVVHPAPDTVLFGVPKRVVAALADHRARAADLLRVAFRAGRRTSPRLFLGEEDGRVGTPAARGKHPFPVVQSGHVDPLSAVVIDAAMPWPPPMHIVTNARPPPRRFSSCRAVVVIRTPVAPIGCPREMPDPLTLSLSRSSQPTATAHREPGMQMLR